MSRTIRRKQSYLTRSYLGPKDDYFYPHPIYWTLEGSPDLTPQQNYDRQCARFHRDHPSGRFGVPRFYRSLYGARLNRRIERAKIHHGIRDDSWDGHFGEPRTRDHAFWNW